MGRGFFAGMSWGAVVGLVIIALSSQLTGRRELVAATPQTAEVAVPGGSEFNQARPETDPVLPETDEAPAPVQPVVVAAPDGGAPQPVVPETAPAAQPETAALSPEPAAPVETPETVELAAPAGEPPAAPEAPPAAAAPPAADTAVVSVPEPSPVAPPADVVQPSLDVAAEAETDVSPLAAEDEPAAAAAPVPPPVAPAVPPAVVAGPVTPPTAPEVPDTRLALSRGADPVPGDAAAPPPPAPASDALPAAPRAPATPEAAPEVAQAPAAPELPATGTPAPRATGIPTPGFANADGVRVNRLPSIGDEETPEVTGEAEDETAAADPAAEASPDSDAPALVKNAIAFDNADRRPVIAVVLLHDRPEPPAADTGRDLPGPVSFAVDAGLVEAGEVARAYRAAGHEIVLVPTLPPGAAATDVEVALQVNLDVVPGAVALMDLPDGGFQTEREAVAQVVAALSATGHGLVTFPRGLNMAERMADRAGVPTRPVFRMLEDGNADAALRTLDQAAFRARQEGAVILVGSAEPATVDALRRWSEANAAGDVIFAPVSAALAATE